jgi:succinoglycan biosynthesis protein ExoW
MNVAVSSSPAAAKVAVVIPYFQRQSGILSKAVKSIARQVHQPAEIIIVDDSSPVPARTELAELLAVQPGLPVRIVEQANGGPAKARNKGLDNVGPDIDYVAFLDSDDEWYEDHLLHAVCGLEAGKDFYFSNYYRLDQSRSVFDLAASFDAAQHPSLSDRYPVSTYSSSMKEQILSGNVIGTSTVVYRFRKFSTLRFREEFVYAGEDYLFWLELSTLTNAYAFGTTPEVTYGRGVNIFAGSGWGTEHSMDRLHYETKLAHAIPKLFELDAVQDRRIRHLIRELRYNMLKDLIHRVANRKPIKFSLLKRHLGIDPLLPLFLPSLVINILTQRLYRSRRA